MPKLSEKNFRIGSLVKLASNTAKHSMQGTITKIYTDPRVGYGDIVHVLWNDNTVGMYTTIELRII